MISDIQQRLDVCLEKAITHEQADMGGIQFYDPYKKVLFYLAEKGLKSGFTAHFAVVKPFDTSACGRAAGLCSPIIIADVNNDLAFAPHRHIARSAGFRSVLSTPILSQQKNLLGVISLHCRQPRWSWNPFPADIMSELQDALSHIGSQPLS